mgnify:CR=1 FL=1
MAVIQIPNAGSGEANDLRTKLRMHRHSLNDRGQHLTESRLKIDAELNSIRADAACDIVSLVSGDN